MVKLLDPQPGPREPFVPGEIGEPGQGLDYEDRGPGLYPNETALVLASGAIVAVSVEATRLENNAGVVLWGNARWTELDGTTNLDAAEKHVETDIRHTITADCLPQHPVETVAREMFMLLLGQAPDGPVVLWSDENRAQANIVSEIEAVRQTAVAPDAAALLGLA